jgi:hypothetical protein
MLKVRAALPGHLKLSLAKVRIDEEGPIFDRLFGRGRATKVGFLCLKWGIHRECPINSPLRIPQTR